MVSLSVGHSSYFSGAAHPNHGVDTINILGPEVGIVTASDIFDQSPAAMDFISDYVALDLRRQFPGEGEAPDVSYYATTYGWELFDQLTFNEAGVQLNLSASSGLPHVFGFVDVYLPWESVGQFMAPAFKQILLPEA